MKPGDPWRCHRCASRNARAVLTVDRRPGCTVCRAIPSDGQSVLKLLWLNVRHEIVATGLVRRWTGRPATSEHAGQP